jgi:hypothetical protein
VQAVARIIERSLNGAEQRVLERRRNLRPLRLSGYEGDIPGASNFDVVHGAAALHSVVVIFPLSHEVGERVVLAARDPYDLLLRSVEGCDDHFPVGWAPAPPLGPRTRVDDLLAPVIPETAVRLVPFPPPVVSVLVKG